jgi:hypothetical protein
VHIVRVIFDENELIEIDAAGLLGCAPVAGYVYIPPAAAKLASFPVFHIAVDQSYLGIQCDRYEYRQVYEDEYKT